MLGASCYAHRHPDLLRSFCGGILEACDVVALRTHFESDNVAILEAASAERAEEVRVAVRVAGGAEHDREFSARALGGRRVGAWRVAQLCRTASDGEELAV